MKKSVRDTRYDLYRKSVKLRELAQDCKTNKQCFDVRETQDKIYKNGNFILI